MNKWLEKFQDTPTSPTDTLDTVERVSRVSGSDPAPLEKNKEALELPPEDLTGIDRQYFDDLYELMVGPVYTSPSSGVKLGGMDPKEAERKAMNIVRQSIESLRGKGLR